MELIALSDVKYIFYGGQWISVPPATLDKIEQNVKASIGLLF